MAGTNLGFPYDAELFDYEWKHTPDTVLQTMINSGAVVRDAEIERLIANGSNLFTIPFYDVLSGTEDVYNGVDNFTGATLTGGSMSGVVYGRMAKWYAKSIIKDFNSGADPMAQIVRGVADFWNKARQDRMIGLLKAVFGISSDTDWATHSTDIASANATVADTNKMGATTLNDAMVKAVGDNYGKFTMAIMHSKVANDLARLQLLEYSKYTDEAGITRNLPLATVNGLTVIINDKAPVIDEQKTSGTVTVAKKYTTYLLGVGAIRYAQAPVDVPSEMDRDPNANGGQDMLYTRIREVLHPYGFSFKGSATADVGIPDTTLLASASYERKMPAKTIMMAQVICN